MRWGLGLLAMLSGCLVPDALVEGLLDGDGDGYRTVAAGGSDCDDGRADVSPAAPERCGNGVDDDCDGRVDEDGIGAVTVWRDGDGDGHGDPQRPREACVPAEGEAAAGDDCDDADSTRFPGATEACDGVDNDCDDDVDEGLPRPTWYPDRDQDGFGRDQDAVAACLPPPGHVANATDCDDRRATVHPGAPDAPYDGVDADCGGGDDFDADGDGEPPSPWGTDCDDTRQDVVPGGPETYYDGVDANCDPSDDDDADGDGFAARFRGGTDCDDERADVYPGAEDAPYDGVDADCGGDDDFDDDGDGLRGGPFAEDCDDDDPGVGLPPTWYADEDLDAWGDDEVTVASCTRPVGRWTLRGGDCDDDDDTAFPGGPEATSGCDGVDNDCDTRVDEDQGQLWFLDQDGDGRGDPAVVSAPTCEAPVGRWALNAWDCDDDDPDTYLGAPLLCRDGDEDCDPGTPDAPDGCPTDTDLTP